MRSAPFLHRVDELDPSISLIVIVGSLGSTPERTSGPKLRAAITETPQIQPLSQTSDVILPST